MELKKQKLAAEVGDVVLNTEKKSSRNGLTATVLGFLVFSMIGLAYASEPLYRIFCQVTGYGGTTRVAVFDNKGLVAKNSITVRFDANVNKLLPWHFKPMQNKINLRPGEQAIAFYEATNVSDKPIVGTAVFNVAPFKVGEYFNKIECFCFTEQILLPGQTVQMPVTFFVDASIAEDRNTKEVSTITLSYTFYASDDQSEVENSSRTSLEIKKSVDSLRRTKIIQPG